MRTLIAFVASLGLSTLAFADTKAPVDARVVRVVVVKTAQIITINKGSADGIDGTWTAKLVSGGKEIGDAVMLKFDKKTADLRVTSVPDPVPQDISVRLTPPASK